VISGQRGKVMEGIRAKVVQEAAQIGVEIIDVRLKRVEYVEQINNSVYERMKAERTRVANELRSTGSAESEKIRADADRQRSVILAEAYRDAEQIRGEGDAKASAIYAEAFGKNPEFYKFYRSLEAYRATFKNHGDVMVMDSSSDFFKYFKGSAPPAPPSSAAKK
jgi:membrane protease subunit HflC